MTTPETKDKIPEGVTHIPEDFSPEVEKQFQEFGVTSQPTQPQAVTDDQGKPIAQPAGAVFQPPPAPTTEIPQSPETLKTWKKDSAENSRKWYAVFWERVIAKALKLGNKITIRKKN